MMLIDEKIDRGYQLAREAYAAYGIDTDKAIEELGAIQLALHCWQGDDVAGFESPEGLSGGGILATGNYPGKARSGEELRRDLELALSLIPGQCRLNLHAIYAETGGKRVERNQLAVEHFRKWIDWAKSLEIGLDFNPTFFSHPLAASGFTLSSKDERTRRFWMEHAACCREIGAAIGRELGTPCVNNIWIPDGSKDLPADRLGHRRILKESLDEIFARKYDEKYLVDALESKLFGIGSEAYVVGSHEFYLGYALTNGKVLCLDMGHFHPTEGIADKVSAILTFAKRVLIHVSRGIRWDSDHVAVLNDDLIALTQEIKRSSAFDKAFLALDYFDASINRIAAWVIGGRALRKAILMALLEPTAMLVRAEEEGEYGKRLALLEEVKTLPWAWVWDQYCRLQNVPLGGEWLDRVKEYEDRVLRSRI